MNLLLESAKTKHQLGDYKNSLKELEQLVNLSNNHQEALKLIADCHYKMGTYEKAVEFYRKYVQEAPEDYEALVDLGCSECNLGRFNKGVELFSLAISKNAKLSAAYLNRAFASYNRKDYKNAVNDFESVLRRFRSGELNLELAELAKKHANLSPNDIIDNLLIYTSACYDNLQRHQEAIALSNELVSRGNPIGFYLRAHYAVQSGDHKQAAEDLQTLSGFFRDMQDPEMEKLIKEVVNKLKQVKGSD